jgi:protein-tyrosine phosphatase
VTAPLRICFVCLGNICRSPTAEGIFRHLVQEEGLEGRVFIDSAGTGSWHVGDPPDRRSAAEALTRGVHLDGASRQLRESDLESFDYVLAMDTSNLHRIREMAPGEPRALVRLLRDFDPDSRPGSDVPDPYYGGDSGFAEVFDICLAGCRGLLAHLRTEQEW